MGGILPLKRDKMKNLAKQVRSWKVVKQHHLEKEFTFPDFKKALQFTDKVGALAEKEGHHPDIYLAFGKVKITTWTHKINGLSESDFILAAKVDKL